MDGCALPNPTCTCSRCTWYRDKDTVSINKAMPYVQEIVAIFYQWVNNYHRQNPIPFSLFDLVLREDGSGKIIKTTYQEGLDKSTVDVITFSHLLQGLESIKQLYAQLLECA